MWCVFFYIVSTQLVYFLTMAEAGCHCSQQKYYDKMLVELVADNLSDISDIFSDNGFIVILIVNILL